MSVATTPSREEVALLPCPFCGGEARHQKTQYGRLVMYWVRCGTCDVCSDRFPKVSSSIAAWNTRTPVAESAGLRGAYRRLEDAARAYFNGYMLDEATDQELTGCSDEQHEAALAVGEALADLSLTRAALATTEASPPSATAR